MTPSRTKTIADLLLESIPRDLVMGVEDALITGAQRAYSDAKDTNEGHRPTVLGHMRHFRMNEAFSDALGAAGANPSPLKGNKVIVGQAGVFQLGRFNISAGLWNNSRRSHTRRQMAEANRAIEQLIQPALFDPMPVTQGAVFFVACFSGSLKVQPESPQSIHIAVPDKDMKSWLFQEPLSRFLDRYFEVPRQTDTAKPKLKPGIKERGRTDTK
ncbi:hypothetical protein [Pseudomonas aeruginosa]|uniref:hypothetical protein n=1 Tax=Pseudomonas aeruginosa TaxID=287 RepID=UPI0023B23333|nr:hypothetical protein [Pseudomonas aeruginosa]MDE9749667.1 hypothetical protein [Pseudomonas aeruginosa]